MEPEQVAAPARPLGPPVSIELYLPPLTPGTARFPTVRGSALEARAIREPGGLLPEQAKAACFTADAPWGCCDALVEGYRCQNPARYFIEMSTMKKEEERSGEGAYCTATSDELGRAVAFMRARWRAPASEEELSAQSPAEGVRFAMLCSEHYDDYAVHHITLTTFITKTTAGRLLARCVGSIVAGAVIGHLAMTSELVSATQAPSLQASKYLSLDALRGLAPGLSVFRSRSGGWMSTAVSGLSSAASGLKSAAWSAGGYLKGIGSSLASMAWGGGTPVGLALAARGAGHRSVEDALRSGVRLQDLASEGRRIVVRNTIAEADPPHL